MRTWEGASHAVSGFATTTRKTDEREAYAVEDAHAGWGKAVRVAARAWSKNPGRDGPSTAERREAERPG